jgi:probable FeS assembly SUF system protein SufT
MLLRGGTKVLVSRDTKAIIIPDGVETTLLQNTEVYIQTILGGMFTVESDYGYLLRIDGKDADALGQTIPKERQEISQEKVLKKGIDACVLAQLKTCYDPEIPVNIVDLGLIYEHEAKEVAGNFLIRIEMTLTAPGCGMGEILKSDVEKKLKDIAGVSEVLVDLVFDPPWEPSRMTDAAKLELGYL